MSRILATVTRSWDSLIVTRRFRRDKSDNYDDFLQMETENESGKGEVVASHFELFAAFEKKKRKRMVASRKRNITVL